MEELEFIVIKPSEDYIPEDLSWFKDIDNPHCYKYKKLHMNGDIEHMAVRASEATKKDADGNWSYTGKWLYYSPEQIKQLNDRRHENDKRKKKDRNNNIKLEEEMTIEEAEALLAKLKESLNNKESEDE